MSRIQQLAEHAKMREDIEELKRQFAVAHEISLQRSAEIASLMASIASLQAIVSALESPRGPGRPRKDHGGIAPRGN